MHYDNFYCTVIHCHINPESLVGKLFPGKSLLVSPIIRQSGQLRFCPHNRSFLRAPESGCKHSPWARGRSDRRTFHRTSASAVSWHAWTRKLSIFLIAKNTLRYHQDQTHHARQSEGNDHIKFHLKSREMDRRPQNTGRVYFPRSKVTFSSYKTAHSNTVSQDVSDQTRLRIGRCGYHK